MLSSRPPKLPTPSWTDWLFNFLSLPTDTHAEDTRIMPPRAVARRERRGVTRRTLNLLELPFDVRRRILQYLLSTDLADNRLISRDFSFTIGTDLDGINWRREASLDTWPIHYLLQHYQIHKGYNLYPNILWTCKQLLSEGTVMLVEENKYIALRFPSDVDSVTIITFMMQSGVGTFWMEPGIFKSPTGEYGKPVVTLDVLSRSPGATPRKILLIVGLEDLGRVCQALSGFKAHNITDPEDNSLPLRVNVDIRLSSFPEWKTKGFPWLVNYFKANVFDWIGDSVDQISCSGPDSDLKLEKNLRSWILRQGSQFDAARSIEYDDRTFSRLVRRFRKAEDQFLSHDFPSAIVSLLELNALIAFSFATFQIEQGISWPMCFTELHSWVHFYLGMSLLEEVDKARDTPEHAYYQRTHFRGAAYYLPSLTHMLTSVSSCPGHRTRWHVAKAELSCWAKVITTTRYHLLSVMATMEDEPGRIDSSKVMDLWTTPELTFDKFADAKEGLQKLIGDIFGPLEPVELTRT